MRVEIECVLGWRCRVVDWGTMELFHITMPGNIFVSTSGPGSNWGSLHEAFG